MFLREAKNYREMLTILEAWETLVYIPLLDVASCEDDLRTTITLTASGDSLEVVHEADSVRHFQFISDFAEALPGTSTPTLERCKEVATYLRSLSSLTICFYLRLGPDIDWGLGVRKPLDRKGLIGFLQGSPDKNNVLRWNYASSQPIPIGILKSCLEDRRVCTFYSFDSHKYQNFACAFSLFEHFGVPMDSTVQGLLLTSSGEEVQCTIELLDGHVKVITVSVIGLHHTDSMSQYLDQPFNSTKWKRFQSLFDAETTHLTMSPSGLTMSQSAPCSPNRKVTLI